MQNIYKVEIKSYNLFELLTDIDKFGIFGTGKTYTMGKSTAKTSFDFQDTIVHYQFTLGVLPTKIHLKGN